MKERNSKGWLFLGGALLILAYAAVLYRLGAFSSAFAMAMFAALLSVGPMLLIGYRHLGSFPAWGAMLLGLAICWFGCGDGGTGILLWALCCGTPLAVTLLWPPLRRIRPLAMAALPLAGGIWLGGALLYSKLHFGGWRIAMITERIGEKYLQMVAQMEDIYQELYPNGLPAQFSAFLEQMKAMDRIIGFFSILLIAYALFGGFFISVWLSDRMSEERWLGSWGSLLPGRGVTWLFMLGYLFSAFLPDHIYETVIAAFNLFGFIYVFVALYALLQMLRKKKLNAFLRFLIIGGSFALSYLTVGGSFFSPYMILTIAGLSIALMPRIIIKKIP